MISDKEKLDLIQKNYSDLVLKYNILDKNYKELCKEALEQPAQEPVNNCPHCNSWFTKEIHSIPTHQWQGLTDDEINETVRNVSDDMYPWKGNMLIGKIIRAIEAKLKEKNT